MNVNSWMVLKYKHCYERNS